MTILDYFFDLFETNKYTAALAAVLAVLPFLKKIPFPRLSHGKCLALLLILCAVLRIGWIAFSSYEVKTSWKPGPAGENDMINIFAIDMTRGVWFHNEEGDPIARRPIGYPLFLGFFYKIFGPSSALAYGLQFGLQMLTALLVYLLGKRLFGAAAGLIALLFFAIHPVSVYAVKFVTDENLFLPLWYFGLYLLIGEAQGKPVRWPLLWYGILFGYAAMTRTHAIMMPTVVALTYGFLRYSWRRILAGFFVTFFVMQLVNLPWVIRNYHIWGVPIVYTTSARAVYSQLNATATPEGGRIPGPGEAGYSAELDAAMQAGDVAKIQVISQREMRNWILTHPFEFLNLGLKRLLLFIGWQKHGVWVLWHQFYEGSYDPSRPLSPFIKEMLEEAAYLFYYLLFFIFIFSTAFVMRRWKTFSAQSRGGIFVLGCCLLFWFLLHLAIYPEIKYRYPLEPLMMIFAAYFASFLLGSFRWRNLPLLRGFLK